MRALVLALLQALGRALQAFLARAVALVRWTRRVLWGALRRLAGLAARGWSSAFARRAARTLTSAARVGILAALVAGVGLGLGWLLVQRVPPGAVGVRQLNFGGGIEPADQRPGLVFSPRGLESWHLVEQGTQVLDFAWESEGGDHPPLEVRTRDGNACNLAVTVLYRVRPGEAHLLVRDGLRGAWRQRVRATVEKVVLEEFGNLSTPEFADTDVRLARCESALATLNGLLRAYHVEAERLLVTSFLFALEYEKKLQEKQHAAQDRLMAEALQQLGLQRQENSELESAIDTAEKRIRAELDLEIQRRYAAGRRRIVELETEAREYDRLRKAEAEAEHDRLVAEGERLLEAAGLLEETLADELWDSPAGRILLARRAAENLNLQSVTLNSNDPRVPSFLDLDQVVRLLLGSAP